MKIPTFKKGKDKKVNLVALAKKKRPLLSGVFVRNSWFSLICLAIISVLGISGWHFYTTNVLLTSLQGPADVNTENAFRTEREVKEVINYYTDRTKELASKIQDPVLFVDPR